MKRQAGHLTGANKNFLLDSATGFLLGSYCSLTGKRYLDSYLIKATSPLPNLLSKRQMRLNGERWKNLVIPGWTRSSDPASGFKVYLQTCTPMPLLAKTLVLERNKRHLGWRKKGTSYIKKMNCYSHQNNLLCHYQHCLNKVEHNKSKSFMNYYFNYKLYTTVCILAHIENLFLVWHITKNNWNALFF